MLVICLSACQPLIAPPSPPSSLKLTWKERQIALSRIQNWQVSGKVAVRTSQDSGSATVNWTQKNKQYIVSLLGPLGTGGFKLIGQPATVILETSDGKHYTATSPEQLLAEHWGFRVPISSLAYWVRGLPVAGITYTKQLDTSNRLSELIQQGWQIHFLSYIKIGSIELPDKIEITSTILKAKLIIYRWDIFKNVH